MKFVQVIKAVKNPFLLFLPFLILYLAIVITFPPTGTYGDENRYLLLAQNLLHGYFSPNPPDIDLGNGPGYPILLVPFIGFHLPLIFITILNAILYYLSLVLLYKSLLRFSSFTITIIICLYWAIYINVYEYLTHIVTEVLTVFLVCLLTFSLLNAYKYNNLRKAFKAIIFSGMAIGYLALTKPIFGYVIMFLSVGTAILIITNWKSVNYRKIGLILLVAMVTVSPYLIYSYHLTGRAFYWGSNGGNNLYWMSSPYKSESGSWIEYPFDKVDLHVGVEGSKRIIDSLHKQDFEKINKYIGVKRDDTYKKIAITNIKSHPVKFLQNCFSNLGRMLFNFPYSYKIQKPHTLLRLPFNGIILVLILFCLIPTFINWRKIIFPLRFLLVFCFLYFGGSILGSAETRMFTMVVPILLFWVAYILEKTLKVNIKF